jgi:hypothetical protein
MANFRKDQQVFGPTGHDKTVFEVPMIAVENQIQLVINFTLKHHQHNTVMAF